MMKNTILNAKRQRMKAPRFIFQTILFITFCGTCSCQKNGRNPQQEEQPENVQIISDFDRGSIGSLTQISENKFRGQTKHWIKSDNVGDNHYWFYFKIVNVKGKEFNFQLNNLTGIYRNEPIDHYTSYTQPVISYDQKQWNRITNVGYDEEKKQFDFTVGFTEDTAWVAYAHPYPYSQGIEYLESIELNPNLKISKIGESSEGRAIQLLEITNFEKGSIGKKNIFTMALQHGGEDCGGYFTEGMINFLLSSYIILMMNPDGLYHGITRYTANMEDLNSEWDDDITDTKNLPVEPEVLAVKNWMREYYKSGGKLDLFLDIHGQSQKWTGNAFWDKSHDLEKIVEINKKSWGLNYFESNQSSGNTSTSYFYNELGISSATLELTQSYTDSVKKDYLKIQDYHFFGESFVKSVNDFFK